MADLITLDDYKTFEGISSTKEDEKLEVLIPSVSQLVKTYCANSINDFVTDAKEEFFTLDYATNTIQLTEAPVLSISNVEIKENIGDSYASLAATNYDIDKRTDSLMRLSGVGYANWPKGPNSVKVTYRAGYSQVPLDLKLAVVDLITYYLKDEHKPRSTLSGATQEYNGATRDTGFPDHIRRVLDLYRQLP